MDVYKKAYYVVKTLQDAGFIAYFAGGWVRDFYLKHPSDDIDIATNATPEDIQKLFPKTIPVGVQFGIIIVRHEDIEFEVATFRKDLEYQDGRRPTKIEYTEAKEDAIRRDFTINGLFYDPITEKVFDFVEGKIDIEHKIIRAIGDAHERFFEDRLRMIRAIRYATRFNFTIEEKTKEAILAHCKELFPAVAIERVYQEFTKMHSYNNLRPSLLMLHQYNLLNVIFKELEGIDYEVLEKRLRPLSYFPEKSPVIGGLLLLFDDLSEEKIDDLADYLKISNQDRRFAQFLFKSISFVRNTHEAREHAYFYADPFSKTVLEIIGALHPKTKEDFLHEHIDRKKSLSVHIERIENKSPLIQSKDILDLGVKPGPILGELLTEAERITINQDLSDRKVVLEKLKESSIWKERGL